MRRRVLSFIALTACLLKPSIAGELGVGASTYDSSGEIRNRRSLWSKQDQTNADALFPGDEDALRRIRLMAASTGLLRSTVEDLWALELKSQTKGDYSNKFRALEQLARSRGAAVTKQYASLALQLPPDIDAALQAYKNTRLASRQLELQVAGSVALKWSQVEPPPAGKKLRLMSLDTRLIRTPEGTADAWGQYAVSWYLDISDASLVGIRPTKTGWQSPLLPVTTKNQLLVPSTIPNMFYGAPVTLLQQPKPAHRLVVETQGIPSIEELRKSVSTTSGFLILEHPVTRLANSTRRQSTAMYPTLRPLYFQQAELKDVILPDWALLSSHLAKGDFYAKVTALATDRTLTAAQPEFYFLQQLFPGTLTNEQDLRDMQNNPPGFVARHLTNLTIQPGNIEQWHEGHTFTLLYYWWE